ncbi:MAG TPA: EAL domain-containing protein [Allosphingosinicella sp.]|nr:EAL domain-containing protein [Allosphingosinicella sp.]
MTSIGSSLTRTQTISAALFLLVSLVGAGAMQETRSATAQHGQDLAEISSVMEIADLISETRIAEAYLLFDYAEGRPLIEQRNRELTEELAALNAIVPTGADAAQARHLTGLWAGYRSEQRRMIAAVEAGHPELAVELFEGSLEQRYQQIDSVADSLGERLRNDAEAAAARARNIANIVTGLVLSFCAFGILLGFAMHRFVRRRIVRPLTQVTASLTALASGDTNVAVTGGDRGDEIGSMVGALEIFRLQAGALDEQHRLTIEAQANAEKLARHDALTGLPNRRLFLEALARTTEDQDKPAAIFLFDLDRFKPVNDAYGHDAGDEVLCVLADRFAAHRDELGVVARLGGDEFATAFPTSGGPGHAARVAQLINIIVSQPIELENCSVEVGATIGVAMFPQDGADASTLLRAADLAMYEAKADESCRYRFFQASMENQIQERALLHADLRRAVAANEIRPHYQPLVTIDGGELVGFEVLARWYHPVRGIIMPDAFIAVAEELGVLPDLSYRVMRQACADARHWPEHLSLSVNLAPSQLRDPTLEARILEILSEAGIAPGRIEIEVTENALITDLEATREMLSALQKHGMSIALDDFGTGYASLNHLRDLKFDKIKIDRSFVSALDAGGKNAEIVRAMISLGKSLGLTTTAEGIEDAEQWSSLAAWGCDLGQGFLFGKGMNAEQALAMIGVIDLPGRPARRVPMDGVGRVRFRKAS